MYHGQLAPEIRADERCSQHTEENPYAERLIRTIKEEEVYLSDYQDFTDAHQQLARFLDDVYNCKRIHSALGYLTPLEFASGWALRAA